MKLLATFITVEVIANSDKAWRAKRHAKSDTLGDEAAKKLYDEELTQYQNAKESDQVLLLDWYDRKQPFFKKLSDECGGCWMTNDNQLEKESTGILVDNTRYVSEKGVGAPSLEDRNPNQYWIFWPREAASKNVEGGARMTTGAWDAAFNLTTSYRLDSDIPRPFGDANSILRYVRYKGDDKYLSDQEHFDLIMSRKNPPNTKYAAWMVSNCDKTGGASKRWEYVQALIRAGLKLDGYGECFDNLLKEKPWSTSVEKPTPFAPYKFYLAFENSIHCNGYVSEKLWRNSYQTGAVPVVFGPHKDDVEEQAPPNSFIHAEDFATPADLVKYLDYLDNNSTAYLEYHEWRKADADLSIPYIQPTDKMICGSCKKLKSLKSEGFPRRTIDSVAAWWWRDLHDDQCIEDAILPDSLLAGKKLTFEPAMKKSTKAPPKSTTEKPTEIPSTTEKSTETSPKSHSNRIVPKVSTEESPQPTVKKSSEESSQSHSHKIVPSQKPQSKEPHSAPFYQRMLNVIRKSL